MTFAAPTSSRCRRVPPEAGRDRPTGRAASSALVAGAAVVMLAGCGGTAASSGSASGSGSVGATGSSSAPNPNAPEVNAAGDIPDNQVYVPFSPPGAGFTVSVPQGWAQSTAGSATVFTDKFNSVRLEVSPAATAPDVTSATTHEVPALQASAPKFVLGKVTTVDRAGGKAVLITYQAASAPNPVTGKSVTEEVQRYEFWRAGREAVLTLSGPKGADNVDPWQKVSDSFRWQ